MNILANFHQEQTIFDEIRGYLLIFLFYRALTRASEGLLLKKGYKICSGGPIHAKFSQNMSNMMILKVKKFGAPAAPQIFLLVTSR